MKSNARFITTPEVNFLHPSVLNENIHKLEGALSNPIGDSWGWRALLSGIWP